MVQLNELYDGDKRLTSPEIRSLSEIVQAPHPLCGVGYADGTYACKKSGCETCQPGRSKALKSVARQLGWK